MPHHFLIDCEPAEGLEYTLDSERSHYLARVMRVKPGQILDCFNGRGSGFTAEIRDASPRNVQLRIIATKPVAEPGPYRSELALGLLKGQAMDRSLQLATELGVDSIHVFPAHRSNAKLQAGRRENRLEHWTKVIRGACEQCGRMYVPDLHLSHLADIVDDPDITVVVCDADADPLSEHLKTDNMRIIVGPEGGWSDAENTLFSDHGLRRVSLGPLTLRAESVPAVVLTLLNNRG